MTNSFYLEDRHAWYHDEGHNSGYFHTYDALVLESDRDLPRKIHVFLPRDYGEHDRPYPVVYMNDGNITFWPDGLSPYSWEVPKTLEELYKNEIIQRVIIVAIHPLDRSHEYLHVKEFSGWLEKEGGGLSTYADYLVRLKHFIDRSYNTLRENKFTTIVGSSHGGLAAFYTGCIYGQYFGKVAALSPSFWAGGVFNLRDTPLIAAVDKYLRPDNINRPQIGIDWGCKLSGGFHNLFIEQLARLWSKKMVKLLQSDYDYVLNENLFKYADSIGGHDERAWAYRFSFILEQYYQKN